jgi:hypothetical protein
MKRRAATRRPGPPYEYSAAYVPALPERRSSLRTASAGACPPRRRRQRRPQSAASLSGSAGLRELAVLDLDGFILDHPRRGALSARSALHAPGNCFSGRNACGRPWASSL